MGIMDDSKEKRYTLINLFTQGGRLWIQEIDLFPL